MSWKDYLPPYNERPIEPYGTIVPRVLVIHQTTGDMDDGSDAVAYMFSRTDGIRWHWTVGADGTAWWHAGFNAWMAHALGINDISVGIEHDMPLEATPPEAMYETSAKIAAAFCHYIEREPSREFIIGHNEDFKYGGTSTHTDPGDKWDWGHYMALVRAAYEGDNMTDLEKQQLAEALEKAREAVLTNEGMVLRLQGEPEPGVAGPRRAGWRHADAFLLNPVQLPREPLPEHTHTGTVTVM